MFSVLSSLIVSRNISFSDLFAPLIPSVFFPFWVKLWVKAAPHSPHKDFSAQMSPPPS